MVLVAAFVLNERALAVENGIASDAAFGPFTIAALLAGGVCVVAVRTADRFTRGTAMAAAVFMLVAGVIAVIGAFLVLGEPAVFNAGYGCLGRRPDVWLAMALRPTPAPCGYLIPASDEPLFYPAAVAAFGAAALAVTSAILYLLGRNAARA